MKNYEIITIFQDTTEVDASKKLLHEILSRYQAVIKKEDDWGVKRLPHELKKKSTGFFHLVECELDPQQVKAINHDAHLVQDILHIMVKSVN